MKGGIMDHYAFLRKFVSEINAPENPLTNPYLLAGEVEDVRLEYQNAGQRGWGDEGSFLDYLKHLEKCSLLRQKQDIVLVGTGKNAAHIPTILEKLKPRLLYVVELSGEKITGAKKTLTEKGIDLSKIDFRLGNVAKVLPEIGEVDLIINQLFMQHQPTKEAPFWLPQAAKANYSTRDEVVAAMIGALKSTGFMITADLVFYKEWHFEPLSECQEAIDLAKEANLMIPVFMELGWFKRGAQIFSSKEEIKKIISQSGQMISLDYLDYVKTTHCLTDSDDREFMHIISSYIVAAIYSGIYMNYGVISKIIKEQPGNENLKAVLDNFVKGLKFFQTAAPRYLEICQHQGVSLRDIKLHYLIAQKKV